MRSLAELIYRFRVYLFLAVVVIAVVLASCLRFEMNNQLDAWFTDDDPVSVNYRLFRDTFEGGNSLIIGIESDDLFSRENLDYLIARTSALEGMEHVRRVVSLANANKVRGTPQGIEIRPLLHDIEGTPGDELKRSALQDELFVDYLISKDGRMSAIFVVFDEIGTGQVEGLVEQARAIMEEGRPDGVDSYLSGGLMVSNEFIKATRQNQTILPALGVIIGIIIIYALFRSLPRILIITVEIGLCMCWTLGFHSMLGFTYNPVSGMIIPLIVVLSLSNSIHMIEYYDEVSRENSPRASFIAMVRYIAIPCFIASITTTFGLLSLATSPIKAVKQFGITSGAGILFSFIISLCTVPFLLTILPGQKRAKHKYWGHVLSGISRVNENYYRHILMLTALLVVLSFAGLPLVTIDSNELDWFPRDSELYVNAMKFDHSLSGIGNLELILQGEQDMLLEPEILSRIDELSRRIESLPRIRKVISLADYVKAVNRTLHEDDANAYRVPDTRELIAQEVLLFSMSETGREELDRYANVENSSGRISVRLQYTSSSEVRQIVGRVEDMVREIFPDNKVTVSMTGFSYIFSMIDKYIVESQIRSFSLAFVLVFGIMFLVMWSARYGMLAIVPNVLPVLLIIGIMGWAGISLNVGTVMIASVALGIAVDDTTHLLTRFRKEYRSADASLHGSLRRSIILVGRAMIFTSLISVCGFCIVIISDFQPSRDFGILLSLTLFIAVVCDLFMLPAIMIAMRRFLKPQDRNMKQ